MSTDDQLSPLPFDAPWQAEVFALTTHLNESGLFTWTDWAERFGAALAASEEPVSGGEDYYTIWLDALLQLLIDLGHASPDEVEVMKARWIKAYEDTPHGEPVELVDES
jgi:nitrile hydratase accessory protein